MADRHVSVPKLFASGDATDWFQRFDICSKAKGWNDATEALKLPTMLEGEALAVWLELELSEEEQGNYVSAKGALVKTMMPMELVSLDDFHRRKLQPLRCIKDWVQSLSTWILEYFAVV